MEEDIKYKTMPAQNSGKTFAELDAEGWEQVYSFHAKLVEQWNDTADRAQRLKDEGKWELVLADGATEEERKDTVRYLYKREKKI